MYEKLLSLVGKYMKSTEVKLQKICLTRKNLVIYFMYAAVTKALRSNKKQTYNFMHSLKIGIAKISEHKF